MAVADAAGVAFTVDTDGVAPADVVAALVMLVGVDVGAVPDDAGRPPTDAHPPSTSVSAATTTAAEADGAEVRPSRCVPAPITSSL
jgi:hypothetical protein